MVNDSLPQSDARMTSTGLKVAAMTLSGLVAAVWWVAMWMIPYPLAAGGLAGLGTGLAVSVTAKKYHQPGSRRWPGIAAIVAVLGSMVGYAACILIRNQNNLPFAGRLLTDMLADMFKPFLLVCYGLAAYSAYLWTSVKQANP